MIPDFAAASPRALELDRGKGPDWAWLRARYAALGPAPQLEWVFDLVEERATSGLFEHEYIDADYRNEYTNFYIKVFERVPDRCERLHFWDEDTYLGYCSIRPIAGAPVGRTALAPTLDDRNDIACLVRDTAHPYGRDLSVEAFPFISQDRRYGRCAHAVIWMISRYHKLRFDGPRRFMSDIVDGASAHEFERVVPSSGLTPEQIGAAFRHIGLAALRYDLKSMKQKDVRRIVVSYLNSEMPLGLGIKGHLTALIGGGEGASGLFGLCSDDERGAYTRLVSSDWKELFVPLPERIYLRAEEAYEFGRVQLEKLLAREEADKIRSRVGKSPTLRCFVVQAREQKQRILERQELPAAVRSAQLQQGTPRWTWILEVLDPDRSAGEGDVLGEIAIDATSGEQSPNIIYAHLPTLRIRDPGGTTTSVASAPDDDLHCYHTASALGLI